MAPSSPLNHHKKHNKKYKSQMKTRQHDESGRRGTTNSERRLLIFESISNEQHRKRKPDKSKDHS